MEVGSLKKLEESTNVAIAELRTVFDQFSDEGADTLRAF